MRPWLIGLLLLALLIAAAAVFFRAELQRLRYQRSLFTGAPQHEHFVRQEDYYPVNEMPAAPTPVAFLAGPALALPRTFEHRGATLETAAFLERTDTAALLVLHRGAVRHESYALSGGPEIPWLTHSVSKSLVATAVGIALRKGLIAQLSDPIDRYVPALAGSGYAGVSILDVLQMASGIRWNEDYADRESDLNRFGAVMFRGDSYDAFVAQRVRERPPGEYHSYVGMNSQALTMLVRAVTGESLATFLSRELWSPLGAQDRAYWSTDRFGVELGLGGLSASARDLAKVGELYRKGGQWQGTTLLDAAFVKSATSVTAAHLARGPNPASAHRMGYGYHWWLPDGDEQDYSAIGIYNQFVYVSPAHDAVIVKLSAYRDYATSHEPSAYLEAETFSLLRALARLAASEGNGDRIAGY
ncbi:MAG: serine hydrolase domain-containing protein [Pseudomonadota bacterium]